MARWKLFTVKGGAVKIGTIEKVITKRRKTEQKIEVIFVKEKRILIEQKFLFLVKRFFLFVIFSPILLSTRT